LSVTRVFSPLVRLASFLTIPYRIFAWKRDGVFPIIDGSAREILTTDSTLLIIRLIMKTHTLALGAEKKGTT
ncbi:MAG: hypothetical protein ACI3XE_04310, partial [Eubacteriales bacterium]